MKQSAVAERILPVDLVQQAEGRYLNYALSVITSRALPDVRDGLKPVQRRLLYAMFQNLRLGGNARPRKSAAVVGEVLGKYHPHGDQAAYDAMVRLAQPFSMRYPLVHGEGNFGSLDGDNAAAMRYTEAKLVPLAEELFRDLRGQTIPYRPNYDATVDEPVVLPSALPQLLLNGASGIAVGMATNIPPHNFHEVVKALLAMLNNPDITTAGLLRSIKGPDFPTGGEILTSRSELRQIYETGQGTLKLRGEWRVEALPRGKRQVVITSLPYTVNKAQLVEKIAELVVTRKVPQILDVRDESTDDIRIVLELKGDSSEELALAYLCRHTSLQISYPINLTCLVPTTTSPLVGQPLRATLRDLCRYFLDFRLEVITKRFAHELAELETRLHILAGLSLIAGRLDAVIHAIRTAESRQDARRKLMAGFGLDESQTEAILEIRLYQLARLEIDKIQTEQADKEERAGKLRGLLAEETKRWTVIGDELRELSKRYGDKRRSALRAGEELNYDPEAYIVHEEATVVLSRDGWIKRVRELKDPTSPRLREGDGIQTILTGTTRDRLAFFTNKGGLYVLKLRDVPASTGYGEPIQTVFHFQDREQIVTVSLVSDKPSPAPASNGSTSANDQADLFEAAAQGGSGTGPSYLLATARGLGFRFRPNLEETTRNGRKIARLADGDEVVSVEPIRHAQVVCATHCGQLLAFPVEDVSELAGAGRGVILMRLEKDDRFIGATTTPAGARVTVLGSDGRQRRVKGIPLGQRAGKGQRLVKRMALTAVRGVDEEERYGSPK